MRKRIDNLELRPLTYLGETPEHSGLDIVQWYPNPYYGKESEYEDRGTHYSPKDSLGIYIHKECFKHPESCMTIAAFVYDSHEGFYELRFIGDRPLGMPEEYRDAFWQLAELGNDVLNKRKEEE